MSALPKPTVSPSVVAARGDAWVPMVDPLHPMHQELMRRIGEDAAADPAPLSHPARFAAIFYAGVASWGVVAMAVAAVVHFA